MGKAARNNEPLAEKNAFMENNIPVLGSVFAPGTVEGGDVAWLDENTLAYLRRTYRTNEEGIEQLRAFRQSQSVLSLVGASLLPHYKEPCIDVFHLCPSLVQVDKNLAVVYSPLMPIAFRNLLLKKGYELMKVPDVDLNLLGCNVLALAPRWRWLRKSKQNHCSKKLDAK